VSHKAAHRAFTLIEMLVSLAIVSVIVTMVYGSYAATSRSLGVYSSRMACSEQAHLALRMMARQIRCVYTPPTTGRTAKDTDRAATTTPAAFQAEPGNVRGEILSFATTGGFGQGLDKPLGISRVAYRYDESARTLSICCEPSTHRPDRLRDSGTWRPMLTGVTGIELGFHDGRNWQPRWESKHGGQPPQAVRIALTVTDEQGREHHYATTAPILCRAAAPRQQVEKAGVKP